MRTGTLFKMSLVRCEQVKGQIGRNVANLRKMLGTRREELRPRPNSDKGVDFSKAYVKIFALDNSHGYFDVSAVDEVLCLLPTELNDAGESMDLDNDIILLAATIREQVQHYKSCQSSNKRESFLQWW